MKKLFITALVAFLCFSIAFKSNAQMDPESMKKWMEYMTPGDPHKMLSKSNGTWMEESTMWMSPGAPPTKSAMTAENKMIMGGRYQQSRHTGTVMGMPFEGMSTVAYDNAKKVYISTWIDNMGTGISYMEGTYDPKTKTLTSTGKMTDPMTGKDYPVRELFIMEDDNHQTIMMFENKTGEEFKTMEIKLTRKM